MKKGLLFIVINSLVFLSCSSSYYYQVYKATPVDKLVIEDNFIAYEDDNCKVFYNLWTNGGNSGFQFYNKTDKNIYLDLSESFFILNGIAYNYYKQRVFGSSSSSAHAFLQGKTFVSGNTISKAVTGFNYLDLLQTNSVSNTNDVSTTNTQETTTSSGYSISHYEEKIMCIPPKASKIIEEYSINETLFRYCDLFRYPKKKQVRSKNFQKSESPLVFSNRIAYTVGQSGALINVENEFYVSEISNYPRHMMFEEKFDEYCGEREYLAKEYFKNGSPDKFYIRYKKENGDQKMIF